MKTSLLLQLILFAFQISYGQVINDEFVELKNIVTNCGKYGLNKFDEHESIDILSVQKIIDSSVQVCHLQQCYQGIPIYHSIQSCVIRDGSVISVSGERVKINTISFIGDIASANSDNEFVHLLCKKYGIDENADQLEIHKSNDKLFYTSSILSDEP